MTRELIATLEYGAFCILVILWHLCNPNCRFWLLCYFHD